MIEKPDELDIQSKSGQKSQSVPISRQKGRIEGADKPDIWSESDPISRQKVRIIVPTGSGSAGSFFSPGSSQLGSKTVRFPVHGSVLTLPEQLVPSAC